MWIIHTNGIEYCPNFVVSSSLVKPHKLVQIALKTITATLLTLLQLVFDPVPARLNMLSMCAGNRVNKVPAVIQGLVKTAEWHEVRQVEVCTPHIAVNGHVLTT